MRNQEKSADALKRIHAVAPESDVRIEKLDLASLASVAAFSRRLLDQGRAIDLLINNAGVMALKHRQTTADGFEMQLGTNYLGHYALTAQLLPMLRAAPAPRVVNLSSIAHRQGRIDFDDLQGERRYDPWKAYSQSKLAMLMFALELQRRSDANGWGLLSNAAHPGIARTELIPNGPGTAWPVVAHQSCPDAPVEPLRRCRRAAHPVCGNLPGQPNAGGYYGPDGMFELTGRSGHGEDHDPGA